MELHEQINHLMTLVPALPANRQGFATSLIGQYMSKSSLSPAQGEWVGKLIAIAKGEKPQAQQVGNFSGVIALFDSARKKLKYPKIRLRINGNGVVLSVAGERSRYPGSINVAGEGSWGDREWYGRVSPDGSFDPSRSLTSQFSSELIPVLQELSSNPVAAVQRYGKLTGNCMFCSQSLSDARSKAAGFGEACAKNWGMHDQWKRATQHVDADLLAVL